MSGSMQANLFSYNNRIKSWPGCCERMQHPKCRYIYARICTTTRISSYTANNEMSVCVLCSHIVVAYDALHGAWRMEKCLWAIKILAPFSSEMSQIYTLFLFSIVVIIIIYGTDTKLEINSMFFPLFMQYLYRYTSIYAWVC